MCVRYAYQCLGCHRVSPMQRKPAAWLQWVCFWKKLQMSCLPESAFLADELCTNRQCFRQTERGYRQCINVPEPCYFCIRYGHERKCGHVLMPFHCQGCIENKRLNGGLYPRYWRTKQRACRNYLYADRYVEPQEKDNSKNDSMSTPTLTSTPEHK